MQIILKKPHQIDGIRKSCQLAANCLKYIEPFVIPGSTTEELDNKILSLYSLGMSYRDISKHIEEMYGIEISKSLISNITDKIIPQRKSRT